MGVPTGGGTSLGNASGSITINTQQLAQAQAHVQAAARQMTQALNAINPSIAQAQSGFSTLNSSLRQLAATAGISLGVAGAVQLGKAAVASAQLATAYGRQSVAARGLAGSQSRLNELLDAYGKATGGVMDDATTLANVLQLQAVGFGKTADQLDRFARAARGISLATGRNQSSTNQQLLFEMANQTGFRLDQLGLDMATVKARAAELQAANSSLTKEMAYQNAVLDEANAKFGKLIDSAEGQATGLEKLTKSWNNLGLAMGQVISGPLNAFGKGASILIDIQIARLKAWMNELDVYIGLLQKAGFSGPLLTSTQRGMVTNRSGRENEPFPSGIGGGRSFTGEQTSAIRDWARGVAQIERQAANDRLAAVVDYERQRSQIIRNYNTNLLREQQGFALGRARAEQDHADAIADAREGAARREAQQVEELARTTQQARQDSSDRLADMQEDLDRNLAQKRADSAERIAEWEEDRSKVIEERRKDAATRLLKIESDFARERERAQSDHELRKEQLAASLDARGLFFEQARFKQENEDRLAARDEQVKDEKSKLEEGLEELSAAHSERLADEKKALDKSIKQANEAHQHQVADEKEALDKRIAQAQEAYSRQLEAAREADALRLADMEEDFAQRKAREDEDRGIRLQQQAEDHNEQLAEQARTHQDRLDQISRHAFDERQQLDEEFGRSLEELGIHVDKFVTENERATKSAIEQFDLWIKHIEDKFKLLAPVTATPPLGSTTQQELEFERTRVLEQLKGLTPNTPAYNDLIQRLNAIDSLLNQLRNNAPLGVSSMAGMASAARFTYPTPAVASAATGTGGRSTHVSVAMNIYGAPGQSVEQLADIIDGRILHVVRQAAGG